jgi:hypothetical protein
MKSLFSIALILLLHLRVNAQQPDTIPATTDSINQNFLNVYLDGMFQFHEFIKTEIPYVNYVRDRFAADVHLMVAGQGTGSGGTDFTLFFLGQNEFANDNDTLHFFDNINNTEDERRTGLVLYMKMGLMSYVAKKSTDIPVTITSNVVSTSTDKQEDDKWNGWVYGISAYGNMNLSSFYQYYNISGNLSANKVTEEWKLGFSVGAYGNFEIFDFGDGDIYESENSGSYGSATIVNSLNEHWSIGGEADFSSSTFSNYDAQISISPAIEYNIFPYSSSQTKLLTFFYKIGPEYAQYTDTTIFDEKTQLLLRNRLDISLSLKQKWGSVTLGINGSNYFHDLSKNSAGCFTSVNWSIIEGLTLNGFFTYDIVNDQLNLPKGELTDEEILLQLSERATSFNFYTFFGLSYTFGSIYNNVVNPRFEGGNYSFYF